jgi:Na+/proline symporter
MSSVVLASGVEVKRSGRAGDDGKAKGTGRAAVGSFGVPVVGVLASALALGEPLTAAKLVGLGLIGAGVAVLAIACAGAAKPVWLTGGNARRGALLRGVRTTIVLGCAPLTGWPSL